MRALDQVLSRLEAWIPASSAGAASTDTNSGEQLALHQARELLTSFAAAEPRDFGAPWQVAVIPAVIEQYGGSLRLLVDGESNDPRSWQEVNSEWRLRPLGGASNEILQPGNLVLRKAKGSAPTSRSDLDPSMMPWHSVSRLPLSNPLLDRVLAHLQTWRRELQIDADEYLRGGDLTDWTATYEILFQIDVALEWLRVCNHHGIERISWVRQVPFFQAGYYGMHVALDAGSEDWRSWRVLDASGTPRPLTEARAARPAIDVFSGDVVVRPARSL